MNRIILHLMLFVLVASLADATLYRTDEIVLTVDPESDIDSFESDINEIDSLWKRSDSKKKDYLKCSPRKCKGSYSIPKNLKAKDKKKCKDMEKKMSDVQKHLKKNIPCAKDKPGNGPPNISNKFKKCITETTGCFETISNPNCQGQSAEKYRRPDGTCNNIKSGKHLYGAAGTIQARRFPSFYENGINSPRGKNLPNPRDISRELVDGTPGKNKKITDMVKTFGQFVDHDITETPMADFTQCATCKEEKECFPIRLKKKSCLKFGRSLPACGTGISSIIGQQWIARQQVNKITSFVDGSNIYGSSEELLTRLRSSTDNKGLLQLSAGDNLPPNTEKCQDISCPNYFLAGDDRANENLQLIAMHTIWARLHNFVANEFKPNNDDDDDDNFNLARKIVGAILQKIVFEDYLPLIIGKDLPDYNGYDDSIDPSITNSFSAAAFRFGHTQILDDIPRLKENLEPIDQGNIELSKAFFNPKEFVDGGGVDPLIRGLFAVHGRAFNPGKYQVVATTIRDSLFPDELDPAGDLPAFNIQRGRDHAIPGYAFVHHKCKLGEIKSFAHLKKNMPSLSVKRLEKIYRKGRPCSIDLWVGGVLESPVDGGQVGKTFRCLLEQQFVKLRDGDRFYFDQDSQFTSKARGYIRQITLAHVICATTEIENIPQNVFKTKPNMVKSCETLKGDLVSNIDNIVKVPLPPPNDY